MLPLFTLLSPILVTAQESDSLQEISDTINIALNKDTIAPVKIYVVKNSQIKIKAISTNAEIIYIKDHSKKTEIVKKIEKKSSSEISQPKKIIDQLQKSITKKSSEKNKYITYPLHSSYITALSKHNNAIVQLVNFSTKILWNFKPQKYPINIINSKKEFKPLITENYSLTESEFDCLLFAMRPPPSSITIG